MKTNSTYSDFLKHENELTKLKIQAEFGVQMNGSNNLNPAIENIWLNQILAFERSMAENKKVKIKERLGFPVCKPVNEIDEESIVNELQSLMELLHSKGIVIDSVAGVDDREMYRFITEELFEEETDSEMLPNMLVCFIYEEFHPNHLYDIRRRCEEFMDMLTKKNDNYPDYYLCKISEDEMSEVRFEILSRKINLFKDAFDEIIIDQFEIRSIEINDDRATVDVTYTLKALPAESKKHQIISGEGKFTYLNQYDWWAITDMNLKGIIQ